MCNKQIYNVGNYVIELTLPDRIRDLNYSSCNNINSYDKNGKLLWNISELLKAYST